MLTCLSYLLEMQQRIILSSLNGTTSYDIAVFNKQKLKRWPAQAIGCFTLIMRLEFSARSLHVVTASSRVLKGFDVG